MSAANGSNRNCTGCGLPLSRYNTDDRCYSCQRSGMPPRRPEGRRRRVPQYLPAEVLARPDFRDACTRQDFGAMFSIIYAYRDQGWTLSHIGRRCEMSAGSVKGYIDGRHPTSVYVIERVCDGLRIPGEMLGISHRPWEEKHDDVLRRNESELWSRQQVVRDHEESAEQVFRAPDFTEIDDMNRRELLRVMTMAGTLLAMGSVHDNIDWGRLDYFASKSSKLDRQTVDAYTTLNAHLWRVFVLSRNKHTVFPLVRDQLNVLTNSLKTVGGTTAYRRLCELVSSLSQLAGEILFDGNLYTDAAHCYTLAATAGKEANMPDLWACALTRYAFICLYERRFRESAPMLALAASLAQKGDNALSTRQWVSAVQAQTFAGLGDLQACQQALDMAEQVRDLRGEFQNGGWLRFDGSRLAEERGTCYVQLQRPDLAESALADALSMNLSVRRRGGVLTDLAMVGAQRQDLDQIIKYADTAVQIALQTGSGVIMRKLKSLQTQLIPFLSDADARDLNIRISALHGNATAS